MSNVEKIPATVYFCEEDDEKAHDGEGWYYVEDGEDGSVGSFDTADEAIDHAEAADLEVTVEEPDECPDCSNGYNPSGWCGRHLRGEMARINGLSDPLAMLKSTIGIAQRIENNGENWTIDLATLRAIQAAAEAERGKIEAVRTHIQAIQRGYAEAYLARKSISPLIDRNAVANEIAALLGLPAFHNPPFPELP